MLVNTSSMEDGGPGDSVSESESSDDSIQLISISVAGDNEEFSNDSSEGSEERDDNITQDAEEEEEDDILISTIEGRKEIAPTKPPSITSDVDIFIDLSFHPSTDIIAISCFSGNLEVYSYSIEENILKGTIEAHTKSCRALEFSPDGKTLYSVGRDRMIVFSDLERLDMKQFIDVAHNVALTALSVPEENILATGDEEGVVKIWDPRCTQRPVFKAHDAQDEISCIAAKETHKVACTSGDGTITSYDLRSCRKLQQSAPFDSDLSCCASTHNDTMLVCGTLIGQFLFYKWTDFSDLAGIFKPPQKSSINTLLQVSDNLILAGTEDGHVKAYHFFPHKEVGIVGQHALDVECLDVSHDGALVASLCPEPTVKFWDISYLEGFEVSEVEQSKNKSEKNLPSSEYDDRKSFFADLS